MLALLGGGLLLSSIFSFLSSRRRPEPVQVDRWWDDRFWRRVALETSQRAPQVEVQVSPEVKLDLDELIFRIESRQRVRL